MQQYVHNLPIKCIKTSSCWTRNGGETHHSSAAVQLAYIQKKTCVNLLTRGKKLTLAAVVMVLKELQRKLLEMLF